MAGRRIEECVFAVVDVETTGIDARSDRVIEVAVLTCDWQGTVLGRFETLIRPTHLTLGTVRAEMLAEAPSFDDVAGDVVAHLAGRVVAGHNVSFDLRFLDAELQRVGARLPAHDYVCTRELATLLGCDVPNRTLAALCTYYGITFERWHTAGDDTTATAAVLARLLEQAVSYGRTDLGAVGLRWPGPSPEWPELPVRGLGLIRDVTRWPPGGDQPGGRRATEASFRRLGAGPASPSGASVVSDAEPSEPPAALTASSLWWEADLRGLEGIKQLQSVIVPDFRARDDPELIDALLALADLLRRHGGRDGEVRCVFDEAYAVAQSRRDWPRLDRTVDHWWRHLAALRDTAAMVELMMRCLDTPGREREAAGAGPIGRAAAQVVSSHAAEPLVAEQLAEAAIAALQANGQEDGAGIVLAALMRALETAGRSAESRAWALQAWDDGCTSPLVLDWLSDRLEREEDYGRAADVCARALAYPDRHQPQLMAALKKRHRRCQQKLAQGSTLFA